MFRLDTEISLNSMTPPRSNRTPTDIVIIAFIARLDGIKKTFSDSIIKKSILMALIVYLMGKQVSMASCRQGVNEFFHSFNRPKTTLPETIYTFSFHFRSWFCVLSLVQSGSMISQPFFKYQFFL